LEYPGSGKVAVVFTPRHHGMSQQPRLACRVPHARDQTLAQGAEVIYAGFYVVLKIPMKLSVLLFGSTRYDRTYYDELVEKMLGCGNPKQIGYTEYRCLDCGQGSHVVPMSCKSALCLRCAKVGLFARPPEYVVLSIFMESTYPRKGIFQRSRVL
jgi:hypothetical protein